MRFKDWDVLLFPGDSAELGKNHAPMKEFGTRCDGVFEKSELVPVLTCYIPSLEAGSPFHLSVHSWSQTAEQFPILPGLSSSAKKFWQIDVIIDNQFAAAHMIYSDKTWPQVINAMQSLDDTPDGKLLFPAWHASAGASRTFDAAEDVGRIKIEVSAGYNVESDGARDYHMIEKIICFSFAYAPMWYLEHRQIAWPHGGMLRKALQALSINREARRSASDQDRDSMPARRTSAQGLTPRSMPGPLPPTPYHTTSGAQNILRDDFSCYDPSTRDTSYSMAKPYMPSDCGNNAAYDMHQVARFGGTPSPSMSHINYNLPSHVLHPMAPRHMSSVASSTSAPSFLSSSLSQPRLGLPIEYRTNSYISDVSMHTGCNAFPTCTSVDEQGHVVHSNPVTPASVVRSKKNIKSEGVYLPTMLADAQTASAPTARALSPETSSLRPILAEKSIDWHDYSFVEIPSDPEDLAVSGQKVSNGKKRGSQSPADRDGPRSSLRIKLRLSKDHDASGEDKENVPAAQM